MGAAYVIFGRTFQPYHVTLTTLGTVGAMIAWATSGEKPQAPPIKASNGDEEKFIKDFIAKADAEKTEAPAKH